MYNDYYYGEVKDFDVLSLNLELGSNYTISSTAKYSLQES